MLKSLYSGISGLQAHQTAMDVEGNNIANVNTVGFKYSRANFSDLLAQTTQIATAPEGSLGGKNAIQIGLGTSVSSTTRIFSQGSIQATDKQTDVAIQGDGFFIVSQDAGQTSKYTRSGDFKFDAVGNFVDNNGFIVQGWLRNDKSGNVDTTQPVTGINIAPGLTTPAQATEGVTLKANLNSSSNIINKSLTYSTAEAAAALAANPNNPLIDDFGVLFNSKGQAFSLQSATAAGVGGQGVTISFDGGATNTEFRYTTGVAPAPAVTAAAAPVMYFKTSADLATAIQQAANASLGGGAAAVTINEQGKIAIDNSASAAGQDLNIVVSTVTDNDTVANTRFTDTMAALNGILEGGATATKITAEFNAATHSSSIDVFDSLGSKHTVRMDFRKASTTAGGGAIWKTTVTVPSPATINTVSPFNQVVGAVTFNNDGSLLSAQPPSLTFTGNNGSKPNQTILLDLGNSFEFNGLTSFDAQSATSGISQDGFPGGDLIGIRVDQSGTLIGSFSNGRSFGLAQLAMAKFNNNEGLVTEGNNIYAQSANSGDPVIGSAATGGRGFIASSSLESSNVDLSRSLTQLIIVQRGFQANSKTITTSDQLLNTLIQLKQ